MRSSNPSNASAGCDDAPSHVTKFQPGRSVCVSPASASSARPISSCWNDSVRTQSDIPGSIDASVWNASGNRGSKISQRCPTASQRMTVAPPSSALSAAAATPSPGHEIAFHPATSANERCVAVWLTNASSAATASSGVPSGLSPSSTVVTSSGTPVSPPAVTAYSPAEGKPPSSNRTTPAPASSSTIQLPFTTTASASTAPSASNTTTGVPSGAASPSIVIGVSGCTP